MESARDKRTGEIVEAEDLWLLEDVDTSGYVCWGCGIEMSPSAWQKGSKKRPSFNKMPGKKHINCDARAFIRFLYDRSMSLKILDIDADTYMTVFKKLKDPIQSYPDRRVFYSQLLWQNFEQNDSRLIIPLSGGWAKNEVGKLKPSRSYKFHVEWADWSQAKRTVL
ncbi:hypothetical protein ACFLPV_001753 [Serratia marcescens]|uniref:hypothetical protein n=1 Tax=unclassified Serratia (in: enterobacteria) TaxID=2647522 RepID=UPI0024AEE7BD|nr:MULTISPECIES: hypothetical protein [unclassified Serratia (in: enterobacteria)]EMB6252909.1 hypothetical protein [Serratia marcescens]MDI6974266.1 hypothetical protein [Serratia sp. Se-RSBMAAmG]MDI9262603.1 hypothetical protein [Serratia sp. PF2-63]MDI9268439.1 hypothetical protein [Serratia sp. PF-27]